MKPLVRTLLAAGLVAGTSGLATPAFAQDGSGMRQLLGIMGLMEPEREPIDYRARAPLVVPPAMKLPEPKPPVGERNAAWPNDPDVAARRAAAKDANTPATEREKYIIGQRPLLSQEELRRGRIDAPPVTQPQKNLLDQSPYEVMIEPIKIGREVAAQRNAKADAALALGEEPPRRYLSDPPVGLRRPASTAPKSFARDTTPEPMESKYGQREFTAQEMRR